jgi:uncharacterized repeat protein (TIGR01451 family)
MLMRIAGAALAVALASVASAATFNVNTPAEFQNALTTAQANGEFDTINIAAGTYNIAANGTLTYTAAANENFGLTIEGTDSDTRILDGGMQVPILRIDTTAVINDNGISIEVRNMTFQLGNAVGTPADGGALAILTDESLQPNDFAILIGVSGSVFRENRADGDGGAIYIRGHAVEGIYLSDLTVEDNLAGGDGGGAYVAGGQFTTSISLSNIDFFSNLATGSGGGLLAGGFDPNTASEDRNTSVSLYDISFYDNESQSLVGGGGGADVSSLDVNITIVGFVDNAAANVGGGLRIGRDWSGFTMVNSGFAGNTAADQGGGLDLGESIFAAATLTNNTFFGNTAPVRGGGISVAIDNATSFARFYNNIIWGNVSNGSADLFVDNNAINDFPSVVEVFNNVIADWQVTPGPVSSGSNIDADPLFVDIAARPDPDPRLTAGSPAIDTGDDSAPARPSGDFEFDARPFDGDGDMTATTDIGMDEFTGAVVQNADLAVTKTDSPDPVTEGGNVTYTVTVTNNGPGAATNVTLTDVLDGLVTFVSATPTQGTCAETKGTVTCNLGGLANSATATVTIVVTTPDVVDTLQITNQASVSATEPDPIGGNDSATEQTTVVPAGPAMADLVLTKSDSPDPVFSGGRRIFFTLTVTNNGPDDASNVVLTDTLPNGVVFEAAAPGTGTCSEANGVVTCNLGALAINASTSVSILVTPDVVVDATAITNTATVTATEEDPVPGNNTVAETTTVNPPEADVTVSIVATPAQPLINEQITYDITVSNAGPSDDTGVVLTAVLPAMTTFDSATVDQGSCVFDKGTVTCTIGDLAGPRIMIPGVAPGQSVAARVLVTGPTEAMTLTFTASVVGDISDPVMANNQSSVDVAVIDVIDVVIQGQSKGTGSLGWTELLLLVTAGTLAGARAIGRRARRSRVALPAALAGLVAALALAAPAEVQAQDKWYLGISGGRTSLDYNAGDLTSDLAGLGWTISDARVDDSNDAWKYYAGFRVNGWFAVEAGYVDLGEVITEFSATIPPTQIDALLSDTFSVHPFQGDGWTVTGAARWRLVPDKFFLVGRAGLFRWESKTRVLVAQGGTGSVSGDDSGTDAMIGVGVEWQVHNQWSLTADWERYKLNEWLDVPTIGIKFRF